ncbi:MAG: Acg family FMN-binding oxidoreductase [Jatrophihabitans sp.]
MSIAVTPDVQSTLYQAAARATLAPSIHNTQPWRFVVRAGVLDVYADRRWRVPIVDPTGRQLALSCGAAVFAVRASLAAARIDAVTVLLPDAAQPDLFASIEVVGTTTDPDPDARRLDAAAESRHSNRRQFTKELLSEGALTALIHAADVEGAWLHPVRDETDRVTLASLSQHADAMQHADPAYRAEMRSWTTADPERRDGVPAGAVPHVTGEAHDEIPIRDFDTAGAGELPADTHSRMTQTLVLLGTAGDAMRDWLVAGQALGRVLLELTSAGFVASVLSQVVEEPSTRAQLSHDLRLTGYPQLLLRVGVADPTPASPRRPLSDVISTDLAPSGDGHPALAVR